MRGGFGVEGFVENWMDGYIVWIESWVQLGLGLGLGLV